MEEVTEEQKPLGLVLNMEGKRIIANEPTLSPFQSLLEDLNTRQFPDYNTLENFINKKYKIDKR